MVKGIKLSYWYKNSLDNITKYFCSLIPLVIYVFRYDSLTGVPNTQKTIGFEKGSVLFNIGALHTQIGCKQVCIFYYTSTPLMVKGIKVSYW
jgi:hypothetical protein